VRRKMATQTKLPQPRLQGENETQMALVRPMVWPSRIFPGVKIAVSVRDIQLLFAQGKNLNQERAVQFLLYCAGYGVDPRIQQAYLVPFRLRDEDGKPVLDRDGREIVQWQSGLHYTMFMQFATQAGVILGQKIEPDPLVWGKDFDPDFRATITVFRRKPLLPVRVSLRLGAVAQMTKGRPGRAWAESKVGWEWMFRVALLRRGFREAMSIGPAYGAEEFGEQEPEVPPEAEEAEFVASAEVVQAGVEAAVAQAEQAAAEGGPTPGAMEGDEEEIGQEAGPEESTEKENDPGGESSPPSAPPCPKCGKPLVEKPSKYRKGEFFLACSGYPDCRHTQKVGKAAAKPEPVKEPEPVGPDAQQEQAIDGVVEGLAEFGVVPEMPALKTMKREDIEAWLFDRQKLLGVMRASP